MELVRTEFCDLYCGDCRELLPTLAAGSVDAVVTDPPYGIGFKYNTHDDSPEGYGEWIWSIIEQSESKCTPGSPLFVWQAMANVRNFSQWFPREFRLFAAAKNFVQMQPTPMQYAYEPVLVWWTDGKPFCAGTASRDFHIGNTAHTANRGMSQAKGHPCPRPLDQVEHIIEQWVRPDGNVLDPFMGSGTTGVACVRNGRRFIGCEIDPKYFAIAVRRIQEAEGKGSLFDAERMKRDSDLFAAMDAG